MLIAQPREIHLEDPPDFHVLSPHFSRRVVDTAGDRPRCIDLDGRCFHDVLCDRLLDRLPFFSHFLTLVRRPFCVSLLCAYLPACVVLSCPWELARRPPLRKLASTSSRRATRKEAKDELRNRSSSSPSTASSLRSTTLTTLHLVLYRHILQTNRIWLISTLPLESTRYTLFYRSFSRPPNLTCLYTRSYTHNNVSWKRQDPRWNRRLGGQDPPQDHLHVVSLGSNSTASLRSCDSQSS